MFMVMYVFSFENGPFNWMSLSKLQPKNKTLFDRLIDLALNILISSIN